MTGPRFLALFTLHFRLSALIGLRFEDLPTVLHCTVYGSLRFCFRDRRIGYNTLFSFSPSDYLTIHHKGPESDNLICRLGGVPLAQRSIPRFFSCIYLIQDFLLIRI